MSKLYAAGVDVGSLTTKAVIINTDRRIVAGWLAPTGYNPGTAAQSAFDSVLAHADIKKEQVGHVTATGYGRVTLSFADSTLTEIACHGLGAFYLNPAARTIVDIGGQDSKVIRIDPSGRVLDFVMNDKCAAGTGRFLEVMARALGADVEQLGQLGLNAKSAISLSSMCTVFTESEVISALAAGASREAIIAGLHLSIAKRIASMAARIEVAGEFVFTGGVSKNAALRAALEEKLGRPFAKLTGDAQLAGAIGAAVTAMSRLEAKTNHIREKLNVLAG